MIIGGANNVRLDRLTSLRFFAAFAVFGFHSTAFFGGSSREVLDVLFGQGRAGVTFFFILSGFVLAWSARTDDNPWSFYRRRFARVYPSYMVALSFAAVLVFILDPNALARGPLTPFLLQSWIPDSGSYFAINVPAWSLSVEAFFYLLFPIAIVFLRRATSKSLWVICAALLAVTGTIASVTWAVIGSSDLSGNTFPIWFAIYSPVSRLPEFLFGAALALLVRRGSVPDVPWVAGIGLLATTWAAMTSWPSIYGVSFAYMVPFGAVIVSAAQRDIAGIDGWLRSRPAIWAGAISFAFYLLHHILILRLSQHGFVALGFTGWLAFAVSLIASVLGAWMLHRFVELPMDKRLRGRRLTRTDRPVADPERISK